MILKGGVSLSAAIVGSACAVVLSAGPAAAQPISSADLALIREQISTLRSEYDAKIGALESRLAAAEAATGAPIRSTAANALPIAPANSDVAATEIAIQPEPIAHVSAANAMNPGISVVLNGNYVATSKDPSLARVSGFAIGDDAGLQGRGLSLGESEITLAANVDPYLSANLTASIAGDNQISVEEAYIQSSALPGGLTIKGGRFFSAIGYLNERHAHNWSFIDMPLPYRALLGNQYGDDGVQVRWLAPTPFFLEVGGELYRGDRFPGGNGDTNTPGTQTAFVHSGNDINANSSWLAAASYIHTNSRQRMTGGGVFNGDDGIGIASLVYKWAPGGNPVERNLVLSGEYFFDRQTGTFDAVPIKRNLNGWYAQGVYQFTQRWSAGARYARLDAASAPLALAGSALDGLGHAPSAVSGILEYDSSEFGRFRAQFTHDLAAPKANDELLFQYTVIYGPHGAHRY